MNTDTEISVVATVTSIKPVKGLTYFNLEQDYPNAKLTLVLFDEHIGTFKSNLLFQEITSIKIRVIGKITDYNDDGKPRIVLKHCSQVELL